MRRRILVLLALASLNIGVVGTAPSGATAAHPTTAAATPAHDEHHDRGPGHRRHYRDDHDHDGDRGYDGDDHGDHDGGHRRRCGGLVVVCLL